MRTLLAEHPEIGAAATIEIVRPLHQVVGNLAALSQALSQLLANAVKFVDSARRPHIRIWTEQRTGVVRLNIQDNGIGIPRNAITHLFKPFHRAHPAATYPGTGIGLAIVKRVIERQAGSVGVHSNPGSGSLFWVELPAALADERLSA